MGKIEWKALLLMAVLRNVFSLPLELCCPDREMNKYRSSNLNQGSDLQAYFSAALPEESQTVVLVKQRECTDLPSCGHRSKRKSYRESRLGAKNLPTVVGRRIKRFPIHLDPLYQYRYLARSGQCPTSEDGQPEFYCPSSDKMGNWRCIDDFQLCDGVKNCPNGEDELPVSCLFYRVVETHLLSVSQRLNSDETRQRIPR